MAIVEAGVDRTVDRRSGVPVVMSVAVVAAVMQIGAGWRRGALDGSFGFDESVYFFGTQHVWSGSLLYRDFQFVHPPGFLVALAPFT